MKTPPDPHFRRRFPRRDHQPRSLAYHVFSFCLRDVELILAERGLVAPTRRCDSGARNSARVSPTACDVADHGQGTSGTRMKFLSESKACSTIFGGPSTFQPAARRK
jgi:hypothetical protein